MMSASAERLRKALASPEFYELMQAYRTVPLAPLSAPGERFEAVKAYLEQQLNGTPVSADTETRHRLLITFIQLALDQAPRFDPQSLPSPEQVGVAFATLDHIRRLLEQHAG